MLRLFGLSDKGRKRAQNEDRYVISERGQYTILADGMGGRLYGEVASSMAVDILSRHIEEDLPASIRRLDHSDQAAMVVNLLDEWIRDVNQHIHEKGQEDEQYREMGTTLVCLIGLDHQMVLAHIGDSRGYRFSKGRLVQLTEDHSFVNSQIRSGMITEEEARESEQRNIITRAVGTAEKVKPEIRVHSVGPADRFLLCSDGLSDMVSDERIQEIMAAGGSLERVARALIDEANAAGGKDNITVILAESRR